jgi:hypothetical protein
MEGATVDGMVDGLEDPKVQLANMEQAQTMTSAIATGTLAAARAAANVTAISSEGILGKVLDFYNLIAEKLNWKTISTSLQADKNYAEAIAEAEMYINNYYEEKMD